MSDEMIKDIATLAAEVKYISLTVGDIKTIQEKQADNCAAIQIANAKRLKDIDENHSELDKKVAVQATKITIFSGLIAGVVSVIATLFGGWMK